MKKVKVLPETIQQLESLKENSLSFVNDKECDDDQIWRDDIVALDNAIEIIKAYQAEPKPDTRMCDEKKMIIFK